VTARTLVPVIGDVVVQILLAAVFSVPAFAQGEPAMLLTTTAVAPTGTGSVEFQQVMGPFGAEFTADGHPRFDAVIRVQQLPAPQTFGAYSHYVAWAATANFEESRYLGVIQNAIPLNTRVEWNKFRILISAEAEPRPRERTGPVVLRGASSAFRLVPMMPCHVGVDQGVC
jgi:hypothetical protein